MVSEANIDKQHNSTGYWVFIGIGVFLFLLLAWYALTKVAVRVQHIRDNMRSRIGPLSIVLLLLIVIGVIFFVALNQWGKLAHQQEIKTPQKKQA